MTGIVIAIVAYLVLMVGIGIYFNKKGDSSSEGFYLGGRKLGPLVAAMSAEASDMSSYLLMGLPGLAYISGVADVGWTIIGLALGTYLNWLLVAKKLRRYSAKVGAITVPEFFSKRYNDDKNILTCIAAIIIIVFFIPYTASGFKAVGTLFNTLFGVDYHAAMIVGAVIIVGYTILGGFLAVSTTDLIQSIVMTFALVVMVIYGIKSAGGIDVVIDNAKSLPGYLSLNETYDIATNSALNYGPITVLSTMAWGLGYFGMPHILLRFMAVRDENEIKISRRIASVWVVISMFVAMVIGIIGKALSSTGRIENFTTSSDAETIIIKLSQILAEHGFLISVIAGVVLAGILACTMSTADSQLLAAASGVSQNIMQDVFGIRLSERKAMITARLTVAVIAIISVFLAWNPDSSVFTIVSFAWAGFGGTFGPVMLFALFWKRSNFQGALAGMVSGGIVIFVWKYLVRPMGGIWNIYELLPAFLVASIFIVVVSLCTKAPDSLVTDVYDEMSKKN
ncbi:MAG: sodium/proline symporter [Acetatifactor sp.]|nr:sodium/proline symporter [Acetatifactor sp.]